MQNQCLPPKAKPRALKGFPTWANYLYKPLKIWCLLTEFILVSRTGIPKSPSQWSQWPFWCIQIPCSIDSIKVSLRRWVVFWHPNISHKQPQKLWAQSPSSREYQSHLQSLLYRWSAPSRLLFSGAPINCGFESYGDIFSFNNHHQRFLIREKGVGSICC